MASERDQHNSVREVDCWGLPLEFDLHPHPSGTAEVGSSGIDVSLLRANLRLIPQERLRKMVHYTRFVTKLRKGKVRTPRG